MAAGCDWFFENILGRPYKASSGAMGKVSGRSLGAMANRVPTGGPMALMGMAGLGVGGMAGLGYMHHRRRGY